MSSLEQFTSKRFSGLTGRDRKGAPTFGGPSAPTFVLVGLVVGLAGDSILLGSGQVIEVAEDADEITKRLPEGKLIEVGGVRFDPTCVRAIEGGKPAGAGRPEGGARVHLAGGHTLEAAASASDVAAAISKASKASKASKS